jgi:hypothetical protein
MNVIVDSALAVAVTVCLALLLLVALAFLGRKAWARRKTYLRWSAVLGFVTGFCMCWGASVPISDRVSVGHLVLLVLGVMSGAVWAGGALASTWTGLKWNKRWIQRFRDSSGA